MRVLGMMRDGYTLSSCRTFHPEFGWLEHPTSSYYMDVNVGTMKSLMKRKLIMRGREDFWVLNPSTLGDFTKEEPITKQFRLRK